MTGKRKPGAFTPEVQELIMRRAGFRCDRCGLGAEYGQLHHRTPRRMGGTSNPALGLPSNGLLLHPACHEYVESKRKIAAGLGFIVGYGSVPSAVPVYLWNGWHWLTDDGGAIKINGVPAIYPGSVRDEDGGGYVGPPDVAGGGKPVVGGVGVGPPVDVVGFASGDDGDVEA